MMLLFIKFLLVLGPLVLSITTTKAQEQAAAEEADFNTTLIKATCGQFSWSAEKTAAYYDVWIWNI